MGPDEDATGARAQEEPASKNAALPAEAITIFRDLWQELRDERANQASTLAAIYWAATALMAFEGVFLVIALDAGAVALTRWVACLMVVLSVVTLAACLYGGKKIVDDQGRTYRKGSLQAIDADLIRQWERLEGHDLLLQLYRNEKNMVARNLYQVIDKKRATLVVGAGEFAIAVLTLGVGELLTLKT
ncbi:hypothetical protein ACEZCY_23980 [Streptacidiphilus sp. N1-12]|uniref:Uncharacterized protein n=2 Tax=Streptacidiphilus alkalitolerans TaxID=3342712 RepID=A0ABV6WJS2_9ACTN